MNEPELDDFGFSAIHRCPYCNARLYWSEGRHFICLNACFLSHGAVLRSQRELNVSMSREQTENERTER